MAEPWSGCPARAYDHEVVLARRNEPEILAAPSAPSARLRLLTVGVAVTLAVAMAVALLRVADGRPDRATVQAGPSSSDPILGATTPAPPGVELQLELGWRTLLADGDKLVVGTRPLAERDLLLAVLARDDVAFSAFPADGAVLVVGGDRLKAKHVADISRATRTTTADGGEIVQIGPDAMVGPGPALDLGPPKPMAGGVAVRLGDVPQSSRTLAAYLGPQADPALMRQAQAMAASVRLRPVDPATIPPPPPGSRPGFDSGEASGQLRPVVSFTGAGSTYTARAGGDCADVVISGSTQPLAGGCSAGRPAGGGLQVVAASSHPGSPPAPPLGQTFAPGRGPVLPAMIVLGRLGSEAHDVVAVLVDGQMIPASVGSDGWVLVATEGRPFLLEVRDAGGKPVTRTPVT